MVHCSVHIHFFFQKYFLNHKTKRSMWWMSDLLFNIGLNTRFLGNYVCTCVNSGSSLTNWIKSEITDQSQFTHKLYHIMLYRVYLAWMEFEVITLLVIGTDCISSCKSNNHTITTTTTFYTRMSQHKNTNYFSPNVLNFQEKPNGFWIIVI